MLRIMIVFLVWLMVAPTQLGGQVSYLIVHGSSMEPEFQRGDLVIAKEAGHYEVGEIVVYKHPDIGPVFHRIVDEVDGLFSLQGDNNSWVDSYKANKSDIMGTYQFRIPTLGSMIASLRSPDNLFLFSTGASVLIMATVVSGQSSKKVPINDERRGIKASISSFSFAVRLQDIFVILSALTVASVVFGLIVFKRPTHIELPGSASYEHTGRFDYTAVVPRTVYDSTSLQAGEPLFRRISDGFDVIFDYQLAADSIENVTGTYRVVAEISVSNGWKRSLVLEEEQAFTGDVFSLETKVDLKRIQDLVDVFTVETGISPTVYLIAVRPELSLTGQYQGDEWNDFFAPILTFRASELLVELVSEGEDPDVALFISQQGSLAETLSEENTISIFGMAINIQSARLIAIALVALFGGVSIATGLRIYWLSKQPEAERVAGLYGRLIIPAEKKTVIAKDQIVNINSMEHLIRLSQQEGRSILMEKKTRYIHYYVHANLVSYHYKTRA